MIEIWKDIAGYEELYQVSNLGRIKSKERYVNKSHGNRMVRERIMRANSCSSYKSISLSKDGLMKRFTIHRLVANHFIPNINEFPIVNHIDGNKFNNESTNLEWCSASDNQKHAYNTHLRVPPNLGKSGEVNRLSKAISQYDINGNLVGKFLSTREANRNTGVNQGSIASCARGERKSAGGFIWQYEY